jgi:hypothetical protein
LLKISTASMTSSAGWDVHGLKLPDDRRADLMEPSDLHNELVALGVPHADLLAEREQLERKYDEALRLLLEPQDVAGRGEEIRIRAEEMLREAVERQAARERSNPERQPDPSPAAVTVSYEYVERHVSPMERNLPFVKKP